MSSPDDGSFSLSDDMPPVHIDRTLHQLTRTPVIRGRDYWLALRGSRAMPTRAEIAPRDMREFLPHVGLLESMPLPGASEDYFVRIAGGKMEEIFGPMTGQFIRNVLPPEIAGRWRVILDEVRRSRMPLVATSRVAYNNLRHLKQELFIAPLGEDDEVRMLFGALDIWPVI
jgi:hypothetical protein